MDLAEKLYAMEQVRQLKSRYFRFLDGKDMAGMQTIFCTDAVFDARAAMSVDGKGEGGRAAESNDWVWTGRDAIVAAIAKACEGIHTVHHGHGHEVEILGPGQAIGVIAMEDQLWDGTDQSAKLIMHGCGHYHEDYRIEDGVWRIARSRLTRLFIGLY